MRLPIAASLALLLAGCGHPEAPPPPPQPDALDCPYVGAVKHGPGCVDGGAVPCEPVTCYCAERQFGARRWICPQ